VVCGYQGVCGDGAWALIPLKTELQRKSAKNAKIAKEKTPAMKQKSRLVRFPSLFGFQQ